MTHRPWHWIAITAVLAAVSVIAIGTGVIDIPPPDVLAALGGDGDAATISIVRHLRAPRVLLAIMVGAGLGMSGAALQGTLRNGLAEPYLLGVSGGAAVGAVIGMAMRATGEGVIAIAAFAGPRARWSSRFS